VLAGVPAGVLGGVLAGVPAGVTGGVVADVLDGVVAGVVTEVLDGVVAGVPAGGALAEGAGGVALGVGLGRLVAA
jgi:hypothetical protein